MLMRAQTSSLASARRLPGQRQRQTHSSAAQPPSRGIQAESQWFPPQRLPALCSEDQQPTRRPSPIPSQRCLTQHLTKQWPQFKALCQHYAGTRFEEQCQLHLPQKHKATVPESTLLVEMNGLEEQEPTTPRPAAPATSTGSPFQDPPALECNRRLRPNALGDVLHFNNRFAGSRAFLSPLPPKQPAC
jgi:hypothetical protein